MKNDIITTIQQGIQTSLTYLLTRKPNLIRKYETRAIAANTFINTLITKTLSAEYPFFRKI